MLKVLTEARAAIGLGVLGPARPLPRLVAPPARVVNGGGFVELDDHVAGSLGGVVVVRATASEVAESASAHAARRAHAAGAFVVESCASGASPLWRDVASRLGVGPLATEPAEAAQVIARAASSRHAVIMAPLPLGGWDRAVTAELSLLAQAPAIVLVASPTDPIDDLRAEVFEVSHTLDAAARERWWAALVRAAQPAVTASALTALEGWWRDARQALSCAASPEDPLPAAAERLLAVLSLAARAWPVADASALRADEGGLEVLVRLGALRAVDGWVSISPAWSNRGQKLASSAAPETVGEAIRGLAQCFADEPWAQARVAELLLRQGAFHDADEAHARAVALADDWVARRELVCRWMESLDVIPSGSQIPLRLKAAERALAVGEAEEAFRWAQSLIALAPQDPHATLLFGRAALAMGDLVGAKVALDRGLDQAKDDPERATIAAELAEVAYLGGELGVAAEQAARALSLDETPAARLKARNTLGKLLLARSMWVEADHHFAEDAWTAAAAGLKTEELRARLNRGIALMSQGLIAEASAIFEGVLAEGERFGDVRACAFALDNLSVAATLRHDYAQSLALAERTLKLRRRVGDRVATARLLGNLAELRRLLGLLNHAEHAVAFGRRMLGPGMPPARAAFFSLQAARNALARGNLLEARRESARALAESEAAGVQNYLCEACCIGARIAQEEGDLPRASELLDRVRVLASTDDLRAESAVLSARQVRASGDDGDAYALDALAAARASGKEDLVIEAHALLAEIHRSGGRIDAARTHVEHALSLRDQVASTLPDDVRTAFLSRPDLLNVSKLHVVLGDGPDDSAPTSNGGRRSNAPPPPMPREIVGDDPAIRGLLAAVKRVARSNSTVLICGESGTGKELVAEAVHRASDRAGGPLVTVNCAALVETLLLSELFGHEKGAFTGAVARRRGRFELAEGGTLFLDEIGDISPRTQVALLRVLQERTFERVGGAALVRANVRVVCATHRDLRSMVERGEFREDLYYRLRGITLEVPPLRARMGDVQRITDHLLARIAAERGESAKRLSEDAQEVLTSHAWPGNVRELENALRAASLFAEGDVITAATLIESVSDLRAAMHRPNAHGGPTDADATDAAGGDADGPSRAGSDPVRAATVAYRQVRGGALSLPDMKRQIERDCIARALAETKGNISRAAGLLGMKRPRLSQLVKQYGLSAISSEDL